MNDSFLRFIKLEAAKSRAISTGSQLLDRAFQIPIRGFTLIRGPRYLGGTALALEIASACTNNDFHVMYLDIADSIKSHRLHGINLENFTVFKPKYIDELIEAVRELKDLENVVYILDGLRNIDDEGWDTKFGLHVIADRIRKISPLSTVIAVSREGYDHSLWGTVIELEAIEAGRDYVEGELLGHNVDIRGPLGKATVYIEHNTGRVSRGYELAILQKENGISPSGVFTGDGLTERGFWNFVRAYNERLLDDD